LRSVQPDGLGRAHGQTPRCGVMGMNLVESKIALPSAP
jgi:hypothetical protein